MHTCTIIYLSYRHLFLIISPRNDFPRLARYTSVRHYGNDKSVNKEIGSIQHYLKNYSIIMASEAKSSIPKLFCEITEWIDDMRSWPNLMYGDIYNYIITSKAVDGEEMKNFKSLQSYNYFQSGNVDRILHFVAPDNTIVLKANIRSSQTASRTNGAYVRRRVPLKKPGVQAWLV